MLQLGFLGPTIVNSRYSIPPSLVAAEHHDRVVSWVEDAIAHVVLEHPALRLNVVNADTKRPGWVAVDRLDFAHHVTWEDVDGKTVANYDEMLQDRIEKRFGEMYTSLSGRPHWRVLILSVSGERPYLDIVFDYSHAFSDGTGGKIFHETLLRALNNNQDQNTSTETGKQQNPVLTNRILQVPPSARALPPPIEKIAKFRVSAKFAICTAWKELRPAGLVSSSPTPTYAHWAPIRATPYATRFRTFDVEASGLKNILTSCRTHKTTVTGLLHALVLASTASRIPAQDALAFTGSTALDLRRHLGQPAPGLDAKNTMADYVSQMAHEFDADFVREIRAAGGADDAPPSQALVNLVWRCAARVRADIQKRLDRGLKNDLVGLMSLVPDWRAQFRTEASKARPYSFVVTNLGVLDGAAAAADNVRGEEGDDRGGSWAIEHALFAISAEVCGAAFQVSPITVRGGALCLSCSWQDCVVDSKLAEAIVADLARWLRFLGEDS
ncbi:hypothetical protein F4803DRAFT_522722 [Xylaria telfairii]|nr:hypothetical protein F4803DRAFT_522722 [Xylaria telfairii]